MSVSYSALTLVLPLVIASLALVGLIAWLAFSTLTARTRQMAASGEPQNPRVAGVLRAERIRMSISLLAGAAVGTFVVWPLLDLLGVGVDSEATTSLPDQLAMLPWLGLGPGFAGLIVYLAWPSTRKAAPNEMRQADLEERTLDRFSPGWALYVPLSAAGALVIGLFVAGFASTQDGEGHWRRLAIPLVKSAALDDNGVVTQLQYETRLISFPGWYYSVPVMIGVAVLIALTYLALRRTARAPRIPNATTELDTATRTTQNRFVMASSSASFAAAVGLFLTACAQPLMYSTFEADLQVGYRFDPTEGLVDVGYIHSQPWTGIGSALQVIAYVAGIATIWLLVVAARAARTIGRPG